MRFRLSSYMKTDDSISALSRKLTGVSVPDQKMYRVTREGEEEDEVTILYDGPSRGEAERVLGQSKR